LAVGAKPLATLALTDRLLQAGKPAHAAFCEAARSVVKL
jgi:hypothetical protein